MFLRTGLFVLLFLAADLLQAAPDAVVEGIQLPAWVLRDGKRQPLAIGTELKSNDEVATGGNSRLLLRLGDGSVVKLGDKEVLVLIEGKITVTRAGDQPVQMQDPLTYLQAPKAGSATVEAVPREQLKAWAAETEIADGTGAVRKGGRWKLYLGSYQPQLEALSVYDSLRREGYPVRIQPQQAQGGQLYRVRLAGFSTEQEANALGARLKESNPKLEPMASLR